MVFGIRCGSAITAYGPVHGCSMPVKPSKRALFNPRESISLIDKDNLLRLPRVDLTSTDRDFLLKSITSNSAVLFLGAGFSIGAKNKNGEAIPLAKQFSEILWGFLGYSVVYDGTNFPTIFESALKRKHSDGQRVLDLNFRCSAIPDWYNFVPQIFWHRIYTTNVDDLIER